MGGPGSGDGHSCLGEWVVLGLLSCPPGPEVRGRDGTLGMMWAFPFLGNSFITHILAWGVGGKCRLRKCRLQVHLVSPREQPQQQSRGPVSSSVRVLADTEDAVGHTAGWSRKDRCGAEEQCPPGGSLPSWLEIEAFLWPGPPICPWLPWRSRKLGGEGEEVSRLELLTRPPEPSTCVWPEP